MAIQSAVVCSEAKDGGLLVSRQLMERVLVWVASFSLAVEDGFLFIMDKSFDFSVGQMRWGVAVFPFLLLWADLPFHFPLYQYPFCIWRDDRFWRFPTTMVYLDYITCVRYTILVWNPWFNYTYYTVAHKCSKQQLYAVMLCILAYRWSSHCSGKRGCFSHKNSKEFI